MTAIVDVIQTSTYELTPSHLRLPPILWTSFTALNKAHGLWRWYRRIELYRNPDNFLQLLGGHVLNFVAGDSLILRVAAQALLVATRILECVQAQKKLYNSGRQWLSAMKGHYPHTPRMKWKTHDPSWISPSTAYRWKTTASQMKNQMERISRLTLKILKKAFKLSMNMMDAMDAFYWSPAIRTEGMTESFINITKWFNTIVDNKEELLAGLTENRMIIERFLTNSPFTFEQLHSYIEKTLDHTETVNLHMRKFSNVSVEKLTDFGKRLVNGSLIVIGIYS